MKGGITSGVIYPHAVCEFARSYRFRNVGGTSAGAISAAAAAAAEYGRASETGGFGRLAELPSWLGAGTNLFDLFQPQPATQKLYRLLAAGMYREWKRVRVLLALFRRFGAWILGGAAIGIGLIAAAALQDDGGSLVVWAYVCGALLALVGGALGAMLGVYVNAVRGLPANRFGLCSGGGESSGGVPPLTTWLTDEIDRLAGRPTGAEGEPLTFGDLWRGADGTGSAEDPVINLEMMTTNLTHGRPYRLPKTGRAWFFSPAEFRELFPERVVRWMETHPPSAPMKGSDHRWAQFVDNAMRPLLPMPAPENIPVVVATRLSLSFPLLISAVPIWAVDWTRRRNQETRAPWRHWLGEHSEEWDRMQRNEGWLPAERPALLPEAEVCWFSDGGITSNFPVHFFDAPIPRWPTFALNLGPFHPDHPVEADQCENVWLPSTNASGLAETWTRIEASTGRKALLGFVHGIADTIQNWTDNTQTRVPGYRDRIAHIHHTDEEGGMNLNMPAPVIADLTERGRCAAEQLVDRFTQPPVGSELSWDNHRWVRFRSTMGLLEDMLYRVRRTYTAEPLAAERSYAQLVGRADDDPPTSYPWKAEQGPFARSASEEVLRLVERWAEGPQRLADGAPRPTPELRARPRV
jgi:predicted acylesterase/phospholipase RssA